MYPELGFECDLTKVLTVIFSFFPPHFDMKHVDRFEISIDPKKLIYETNKQIPTTTTFLCRGY